MKIFISILFLFCVNTFAEKKLESDSELYEGKEYKNAFTNPKDTDLPNVLIVGDSISIGYTVDVRKLLKGKADVFRIKGNGKFAAFGLQNIDKWTAGKKWDIIHFNWGLWDLCYRNPKAKMQGHRDKVAGKLTATLEEYERDMKAIVAKLQKTKAKLIWCATTPVPEHEAGRKTGDALKYNKISEKIMTENGIYINNLHAHALLKLPKIQSKKGDVHFSKEGYKHLAEKVAKEISITLKK
jgi:hypothetical protein